MTAGHGVIRPRRDTGALSPATALSDEAPAVVARGRADQRGPAIATSSVTAAGIGRASAVEPVAEAVAASTAATDRAAASIDAMVKAAASTAATLTAAVVVSAATARSVTAGLRVRQGARAMAAPHVRAVRGIRAGNRVTRAAAVADREARGVARVRAAPTTSSGRKMAGPRAEIGSRVTMSTNSMPRRRGHVSCSPFVPTTTTQICQTTSKPVNSRRRRVSSSRR